MSVLGPSNGGSSRDGEDIVGLRSILQPHVSQGGAAAGNEVGDGRQATTTGNGQFANRVSAGQSPRARNIRRSESIHDRIFCDGNMPLRSHFGVTLRQGVQRSHRLRDPSSTSDAGRRHGAGVLQRRTDEAVVPASSGNIRDEGGDDTAPHGAEH